MTREINSQFNYHGVLVKVVKHKGCRGCIFFVDNGCQMHDYKDTGLCSAKAREDKQSVIFKFC